MTVKDLKQELNKYDDNMLVEVYASYEDDTYGAGGPIDQITIEESNKVCLNCYNWPKK